MEYNYEKAMLIDVQEAFAEMDIDWDLEEDELCTTLIDELWASSVTGNECGTYTFNNALARDMVLDNVELLRQAVEEFDCKDAALEDLLDENYEALDVIIRCYLIYQVVAEAVAQHKADMATLTALTA